MDQTSALDLKVRQQVYETTMRGVIRRRSSDLTSNLDIAIDQIRAALQRLAAGSRPGAPAGVRRGSDGQPLLCCADAFPGGARRVCVLRQLHLGRTRDRSYARTRTRASRQPAGIVGLALELRIADGQVQGDAKCDPFCDPRSALVGRHRVQLKDDASLPVGRARRSLVPAMEAGTRRIAIGRTGMAAGAGLVWLRPAGSCLAQEERG